MFGFVEKLFKKADKPEAETLNPAEISTPEPIKAVTPEPKEAITPEPVMTAAASPPVIEATAPPAPLYQKVFRFDDEPPENPDIAQSKSVESKSWFGRLKKSLSRSSENIIQKTGGIFGAGVKLNDEHLDALEDMLIEADFGARTAAELRDKLSAENFGKNVDNQQVKQFLTDEIAARLKPAEQFLPLRRNAKPNVILFVGVNGTGKTTTIGKLAYQFKAENLKTYLAAGDTFRAAAVEQLAIWGERNDIPVIRAATGADAAGLVFDAYKKAVEEQADVLMIDTAGRLQNKTDLMHELLKIRGVLRKFDEDLPHEVILVLDATTGANAVAQTEAFLTASGVTGLAVTKLDGTARGGALLGIVKEIKIPVYAVGVGERLEDLHPFNAERFARAVTGVSFDQA